MLSKIKQDKYAFIFCFLGIVLLVCQFLFRSGFWVDELNFAESFFDRNLTNLFKTPLESSQVSPIFFVFVEKLLFDISQFFSIDIEFFLRIYPLFCGLGIVFLYYPTVYKLTESKFITLLSYGLLLFNPVFIYYTSEVKPYICELFYLLLLINIYLFLSDKYSLKKQLLFILVSILGILNSFSICSAFLVISLYDAWKIINKKGVFENITFKKNIIVYFSTYLSILVFLLIYFFAFFYHHESLEFMNNYWRNLFFSFGDINRLNTYELRNFYYTGYNFYILCISLFSLLFLKNKFVFILSFCTITFHIILSYFHYYPFCLRLCFYWFMFIPVMISNVFYQIIKHLKFKIDKYQTLTFILSSLIIIFGIHYRHFPIYLYSDFNISYPKEAMKYINKHFKDGDMITVERLWLPSKFFNTYLGNIPPEKIYDLLDGIFENKKLYMPYIEEHNLSQKDIDYILSSNLNLHIFFILYYGDLDPAQRIWFITSSNDKNLVKETLEKMISLKNSPRRVVFCDTKAETTLCLIEY